MTWRKMANKEIVKLFQIRSGTIITGEQWLYSSRINNVETDYKVEDGALWVREYHVTEDGKEALREFDREVMQ